VSAAEPCWGFHVQSVPAEADRVIDAQERTWLRVGPRSWRMDVKADQPARFHESWLLGEYGPVRCDVLTPIMARRDARLEELLMPVGEEGDRVRLPAPDEGAGWLAFDDAMGLMRAGWLAWSPKQRREALATLCEAEEEEEVRA
jgi:hypothetical protein